ncbi:RNA interference and gene silencing protein [Grosmannia clavigera kw1407]|uniref:RNA interference and gene silencing protein n=1 Tax=Grosmannia clavigera (strain kw1407 / UAMH 11150) TaxID=655863 RepID=F0XLE7_GROCL|nr:RNA interference and gene silencing protein [Grosmannia clavigera kw1407]EFX01059.1 RNA interference and gene silencing protein [Grosmannia clavigera kw1407]
MSLPAKLHICAAPQSVGEKWKLIGRQFAHDEMGVMMTPSSYSMVVIIYPDGVVQPSAEIRALENKLMAAAPAATVNVTAVAQQLQQVSVSGPAAKGKGKGKGKGKASAPAPALASVPPSSGGGNEDLARFPRRPAYGTTGASVVVWANFFELSFGRLPQLMQYNAQVTKIGRIVRQDAGSKGKEILKLPYTSMLGPDAPADTSTAPEVKGPLLRKVLRYVLTERLINIPAASELKSKIITLAPLPGWLGNPPVLDDVEFEGSVFRVQFDGPVVLPLDGLQHWLRTMRDERDINDSFFPKFPDVVDAVGILLGHAPRMATPGTTTVGSSRFFTTDMPAERTSLGNGFLETVRGYFQSVRPATGRLLLNVNVTHGIFREAGRLPDILRRAGRPTVRLHNMLKNMRVGVDIPGVGRQDYSMGGLARRSDNMRGRGRRNSGGSGHSGSSVDDVLHVRQDFARPREVEFRYSAGSNPIAGLKDNSMVTVYDYFQKKYHVQLMDIPVINLGKRDNPRYYPAEWCTLLPGQPVKARLSASESAAMILFACRTPVENARSITGLARQVLQLDGGGSGGSELFRQFGLTVANRMVAVDARVLDSPRIQYAKKDPVRVAKGSWNLNGQRVVQAGRPSSRDVPWTYVHLLKFGTQSADSGDIARAVGEFGRFLRNNLGVPVRERPIPLQRHEYNTQADPLDGEAAVQHALQGLQQLKPADRPRVVLFVLPGNADKDLYASIKLQGDTVFGVHTVCVIGKKLTKTRPGNNFGGFDPQYFANVGLKFNLKLGGVNHRLSDDVKDLGLLSEGKTMVVGYDVIHPTNLGLGGSSASSSGDAAATLPSQVGLVASIDRHLAQWPAVCWEQRGRQEMVSAQLTAAMRSRLILWREHNKALPQKILVYRDGVSEGQFAQVLDVELPLIRAAAKDLYPANAPQPAVSIIVSVKRHHTRFFPTQSGHDTGNISCGTIVDRGVTLQRYWDFYLTAHTAIKGTARPAHYTVLYDEIFRPKFPGNGQAAVNALETLTHNMCYMFNRATKAVSVCPPAYYADLVCTRARLYQARDFDRILASQAGGASDTASQISGSTALTTIGALPRVHANIENDMFYV